MSSYPNDWLSIGTVLQLKLKYVRIVYAEGAILSVGDVVEVVESKTDPILQVYHPPKIVFQGRSSLGYLYKYIPIQAESEEEEAMFDMLYPGWRGSDGE